MRVSRGDSQGTRKWFARDNEQERLLLKKAHCSLLLKIAKVKSVSYHRIDSKPFVNGQIDIVMDDLEDGR